MRSWDCSKSWEGTEPGFCDAVCNDKNGVFGWREAAAQGLGGQYLAYGEQ